ncbi:heme-degrading domain-containing protein [Paracoccus sp. PXZ]|uniref:heme-degrading domain-containing protein n=1 Tax=Paracoccus denitrificans TaxID=266 RepID=UPI001E43C80C|nr:heme-degrading domain-containing protein [Paracoccus denitrificans]UFS67215.1 heme-degrading domain-containing protein [Paracoccus denitrificans]
MIYEDVLERIAAEEARLRFDAFDEMIAWLIGQSLVEKARAERLPVVVNIRTPDATLFHAALPGSAPINDDWARRKSNVTLRCHRASYAIGLDFRRQGIPSPGAEQSLPPEDFATHGGSFPVRLRDGRVVAAVTVSGLPQEDDHDMVVKAMESVMQALSVQQP